MEAFFSASHRWTPAIDRFSDKCSCLHARRRFMAGFNNFTLKCPMLAIWLSACKKRQSKISLRFLAQHRLVSQFFKLPLKDEEINVIRNQYLLKTEE